MSSDSTRDRSLERLLRTKLGDEQGRALPPTDDCIDAETLAAWSDRTLPADALARIDAHLADCIRCQSLLATFAQTAPVVHAGVPFWQRWATRWIVPVAAVGTAGIAIVIWTSMHQRAMQPAEPPAQLAKATQPPPEVIVPPVPPTVVPDSALRSAAKQLQANEAVAMKKPDTQRAQRAETVAGGAPSAQTKTAATAVPSPAPPAPQPSLLPPPQPQLPPPATVAPPVGAGATAANAPAQSRVMGIAIDGVATASDKLTASVVIAEFAAGAATEAVTKTLSDTVAVGGVAGAGGGSGRGGSGGGGGRGGGGGARATPPPPPPPPPAQNAAMARQSEIAAAAVRWRIHLDGAVEKSTIGGNTWDRINFDPPNPPVTGGVAPSADVCWLIGRNGVVLRTIDGAKFQPITFPETVDLRSISAIDGLHATVATSDGRTFKTENGGLSWNPGRP